MLRIESAFLHHFSLVLAVEFCDLGDLQVMGCFGESGLAEFIGAVMSKLLDIGMNGELWVNYEVSLYVIMRG